MSKDWYQECLNAEGVQLDYIGDLYGVHRYVGLLTKELDVAYRTRVMEAIAQARMNEERMDAVDGNTSCDGWGY